MSLWLHLPHVAAPPGSREFNVPGFPETFKLQTNQMSSYMRAADGSDPWSRFFRRQITRSLHSDAIVCNTVEEVETEGLRLLRRNAGGLRVFPVGPLLPLESNSSHDRSGRKSGVEAGCIVKWLDSHESGSVVYMSFGSQNTVFGQPDNEPGGRARVERPPVRVGGQAAPRVRSELGVSARVAASGIRRENESERERDSDQAMGAAARDTVGRFHRCVPEPL
ncbi:Uncharacterized protein M6B38_111855 [Iris pallida]|uniref:Uncharacterized protein n=1 Tax=Iris pallida TaxID=29817 RepID=A0AAX6DNJ2_IRIPA|nr:Uncharacterized protein M6B38_111855 [Iris pallida]